MRRKMFGALLLPIPFAALPVIVVFVGAMFGPGESDELVTREDSAQVLDDFIANESVGDVDLPLARAASSSQFDGGCGEYDLRSES